MGAEPPVRPWALRTGSHGGRLTAPLRARGVRPRRSRSGRSLLQAAANFFEPGSCAVLVEIAPGCAGCSDRPNYLVVKLDYDTAAEEEQIWQFGEQRGDWRGLRSLDEGVGVGLERGRRVGFVRGVDERVGTSPIATQDGLPHPVCVNENCRLGISLPRAGRNRLSDGLKS